MRATHIIRRGMGDDDTAKWCNPQTGEGCYVNGAWQANPYANFLQSNQGTAYQINLALLSGEAEMRRAQAWLADWVEPFSSSAKAGAPGFTRTQPAAGTGLATPAVLTPQEILAAAAANNHNNMPDTSSSGTTSMGGIAAAGILSALGLGLAFFRR